MNRHVMVVLMLSCLALMLFNIGGSADQRGTGDGSGSGAGDPFGTTSSSLQAESVAPLPEFSVFGIILAVLFGIIAYLFVRNQKRIFSSN